jgi:protein involved in polysaccharide export with SLBB domain
MKLLRIIPFAVIVALGTGCVHSHPPLADGIPVRRLPAEILGCSKCDFEPIPTALLRQKEPDAYRLDSGDVVAVFIEDVLGKRDTIPVQPNSDPNAAKPAAIGYPLTVQPDGTIQIPEVSAITVRGLTVNETRAAIVKAVTVHKKLILAGKERVTVDLLKPRQYSVLVIRDDADGTKNTGHSLKLDAYQNDVLEALARTGGMPGPGARNEVVVRRNDAAHTVTRIPLRSKAGEALTLTDADVTLHEGDTVHVEARKKETYTIVGGPGCGEHPLPRDTDLRVLEALSKAMCPAPACGPVTILRPVGTQRQVPILVDLDEATRDPRENVLILPGDTIVLPGCKDCGPRDTPFRPRIWFGPKKWKIGECDDCE